MNLIKLRLLFFCIIIGCAKYGYAQKSNKLIVIVENEAGVPLTLAASADFSKPDGHTITTAKRSDTVLIEVKDYDFIRFYNKYTIPDSLLIAAPGIVRLHANGKFIIADRPSKDTALADLIIADKEYAKRKDVISLNAKIDSLTSLFYSIDHSQPPMSASNDFEKFINYPFKINREAFKNENAIKQLSDLLIDRYNAQIQFYNSLNLPAGLKQLAGFLAEERAFSKLEFLNNLGGNSQIKALMTSSIFVNEDLINTPNGGQILNDFLMLKVIKSKADYSKSKFYVDYKQAYDYAPDYL